MKSTCKLFLFVAVVIGLQWGSPARAVDTLVLSTREDTLTNRFAERVLTEAYARLNISVTFERYPGARSVVQADKGLADGEVARLDTVLKRYTNLSKVPVPLFYSDLSAFVYGGGDVELASWRSLNGAHVATLRGFRFAIDRLEGANLELVKTSVDAIRMLQRRRVDVAVLNHFLGRVAIAQIKAQDIQVIEPPLARLPVFHLLHKKHEALIPKLTTVLEEMARDGIVSAMWEEFTSREILEAGE